MSTIERRKLDVTRMAVTHKFKIRELKGYLTVGLFPDGQPGELFIHVDKSGTTISGLMDAVAIVTSIALQHGVPLETLVSKLAFQSFFPDGPTKNPDIRFAKSIIDYIFRWLGYAYIKDYGKQVVPPVSVSGSEDILADT